MKSRKTQHAFKAFSFDGMNYFSLSMRWPNRYMYRLEEWNVPDKCCGPFCVTLHEATAVQLAKQESIRAATQVWKVEYAPSKEQAMWVHTGFRTRYNPKKLPAGTVLASGILLVTPCSPIFGAEFLQYHQWFRDNWNAARTFIDPACIAEHVAERMSRTLGHQIHPTRILELVEDYLSRCL